MKITLMSFLFLLAAIVPAQAALVSKTVQYHYADAVMEGYLVYNDQVAGKLPGVVVVPEWWGLNDYIRSRANMLAELGYVVFAADVYGNGKHTQDSKEAGALASIYKGDRTLFRNHLKAALDVLRSQENTDPGRLAAIGYCFGGTGALELARSGADLKGVVSFHGGLDSPTQQDALNIKGHVLVLHGADDPYVTPAEVASFEREMTDAGVSYRIVRYPGAVHGFTNPNNKGDLPGALYNAEADQQSWEEMRHFFAEIF